MSHAPLAPLAPPAAVPLTGPELLALQLLARGYSPRQIALLTGTDGPAVWDALAGAAGALAAPSAPEAVAVARRYGLIV